MKIKYLYKDGHPLKDEDEADTLELAITQALLRSQNNYKIHYFVIDGVKYKTNGKLYSKAL